MADGEGGSADRPRLRNNVHASRFEATVAGGVVAFADYVLSPGTDPQIVVMPHTVTDEAFTGRGYASALIRYALDEIGAAGRRVQPSCSFVSAFIQRHPEYARLLATDPGSARD